jgi:exodeoxyribonuclease-3
MDLPGDTADEQCRYLEAAVNGVLVASIYAPNGNPQPGLNFDYKLAWLRRLNAHTAQLYATGAPVVLAGDYNVAPIDLDIYSTKSWDRNALLQPESRAAYQRLLAQGWTDAIRSQPISSWAFQSCIDGNCCYGRGAWTVLSRRLFLHW